MGVQGENASPQEVGWTLLDNPDCAVAVLHRERKATFLHGRPHTPGLGGGNTAFEYETLGATADPGPLRPDENVTLVQRRFRAFFQFRSKSLGDPKRRGGFLRAPLFILHIKQALLERHWL